MERDAIRTLLGSLKSTLFTINSQTSSSTATGGGTIYITDYSGGTVRKETSSLHVATKDQAATTLSDTSGVYIESASGVTNVSGPIVTANNTITIKGKGWGHGVGLSQWGAIGMAKEGYRCEEILRHYYGGEEPGNLIITEVGTY